MKVRGFFDIIKQENNTMKEDKEQNKKETKEPQISPDTNKGGEIKPYDNLEVVETEEIPNTLPVITKKTESIVAGLNTPTKILEFATTLVQGKMCAFKEPADAMIALITGQEMGLGLSAVLGGIYVIEGRPSLGVHIKKAILLQNSIIYKKTRDMETYYNFVEIVNDKATLIAKGYLDEQPPNTKKKAIDTRTEYLFTRYFNTPRGIVKNTAIGMFSVQEATSAGLTEKNNWKNYLRDMLSSRAFSRGANEIADDLLNGMLSFSELADINDGVTYYIDKDGNEQIVK